MEVGVAGKGDLEDKGREGWWLSEQRSVSK